MPPAKPTALKVIEGNRGKRKLNAREPKPRPVTPEAPDWLKGEARMEWERIVPELERLGLLTIIDRAALVGYCQEWARYVDAQRHLTKKVVITTQSGYVQPSPYIAISRQALDAVRKFSTEFGLTPSSRGRMTVPEASGATECPICALPNDLCGCG